MKKKSNTVAKIFAVFMIVMIMLPIVLTTSQVALEYVKAEIYTPWKQEKDSAYEQAMNNVTTLMNEYK